MENDLNRRQWALYNLLKNNPDRRFQLCEIPTELPDFYPATQGKHFHNTGTRRRITADIQAINDSDIIQKVIVKNSFGIKLASREEFEQYINAEFAELSRRWKRTWKKAKKAGLDGQMKMTFGRERDTVEAFTDEINRLRAARLAAGLKIVDVIAALQNTGSGIDAPLLSKMENGWCEPTDRQCTILARIYGVTADSLKGGYFIPEGIKSPEMPFASGLTAQ